MLSEELFFLYLQVCERRGEVGRASGACPIILDRKDDDAGFCWEGSSFLLRKTTSSWPVTRRRWRRRQLRKVSPLCSNSGWGEDNGSSERTLIKGVTLWKRLFLTFEVNLKLFKKGECLWRKLEHIERGHLVARRWLELWERGHGRDGTPLLVLLHHQLHRVDKQNLICRFDTQSKFLLIFNCTSIPGRRRGSGLTFPQLFRHFTFPIWDFTCILTCVQVHSLLLPCLSAFLKTYLKEKIWCWQFTQEF